MQLESNILDELEQWGWWAQSCPSRTLNFPSTSGLMDSKGSLGLMISDTRAIQIDQAIAKLFKGDQESIKAIRLRFICGLGYRDIGKSLGVSKDKAQKIIDISVGWLTGYLYKDN